MVHGQGHNLPPSHACAIAALTLAVLTMTSGSMIFKSNCPLDRSLPGHMQIWHMQICHICTGRKCIQLGKGTWCSTTAASCGQPKYQANPTSEAIYPGFRLGLAG